MEQLAIQSTERPRVAIEYLTFSDGTRIDLSPNDIVVIVGPNNAGKSAALRELKNYVISEEGQKVVTSASIVRTGTISEVHRFLQVNCKTIGNEYHGGGIGIRDFVVDHCWSDKLGFLGKVFCYLVATEDRITGSNPRQGIPLLEGVPTEPIHFIYLNVDLEEKISRLFEQAFGEELVLYRLGGSEWPLLVGQRPTRQHNEDRLDVSYNKKLLEGTLPLTGQGDGMRSFATVLLNTMVRVMPSIILLDEPEAFLHPPQARLIGEFLAREHLPNTQLFIATHSQDVLQGLLNVAPTNLKIIRIQRDGTVNKTKLLDKTHTEAIRTDSVMKYTSVLSGLFHSRVIICESDCDCMFYNGILDLAEVHGGLYPDVLFTQAAGKHRMASLAETLVSLDVDVDVIADIDVLNDLAVFERLVKSLNGDWKSISAMAQPLKHTIEKRKFWLDCRDVVREIGEILKGAGNEQTGSFPSALAEGIKAILRKASPWDALKEAGRTAIPAGDPTQQFVRLQELCSQCGLWIVPVGEVEGFCKSVGNHGPKWVQAVLESKDLASSELSEARQFMKKIWNKKT
jgi:energy-coupling factor transporter ATP-binding protein EcfA2